MENKDINNAIKTLKVLCCSWKGNKPINGQIISDSDAIKQSIECLEKYRDHLFGFGVIPRDEFVELTLMQIKEHLKGYEKGILHTLDEIGNMWINEKRKTIEDYYEKGKEDERRRILAGFRSVEDYEYAEWTYSGIEDVVNEIEENRND